MIDVAVFIQRGVNRGAIFVDDGDRHRFLDLHQDAALGSPTFQTMVERTLVVPPTCVFAAGRDERSARPEERWREAWVYWQWSRLIGPANGSVANTLRLRCATLRANGLSH